MSRQYISMDQQLSKKEQVRLHHEEEKARELARIRRKRLFTGGAIILGVLVTILVFVWLIKASLKPLHGISYEDEGRTHVGVEEKVTYKTNPPSSGSHYADWTRAGIYETPTQDEYLVHSLEHGYVIIYYNCEKIKTAQGLVRQAYAHGDEEEGQVDGGEEQNEEAPVGPQWQTNECKTLKEQLKKVAEENRVWKLIVMPRHSLDTTIALAAWTRIDTFNEFDEKRITEFITTYRDNGPEKTME